MFTNTLLNKVSDLPIDEQIKYYEELVTRLPTNKTIPILKKIVDLKKLQSEKNGL
jgi:hypothetical protein